PVAGRQGRDHPADARGHPRRGGRARRRPPQPSRGVPRLAIPAFRSTYNPHLRCGRCENGGLLDGEALHQVGFGVLEVLEGDGAGLEAAGDRLYLLHQFGRREWAVAGRQDDLGLGVAVALGGLLLTTLALGGLLGLLGAVALELVKRRSLRTHGTYLRNSRLKSARRPRYSRSDLRFSAVS